MKKQIVQLFGLAVMAIMLVGCAATQPVTWSKTAPMDLSKGTTVKVDASCEMPDADITFLKSDIQKKVSEVLAGNPDLPDAYRINVTITKYEEGSAFARFMLIGLGQMYLYGTVDITQGTPPVVIRQGDFKKNYCVGGVMGASATMQKDVLPKVGEAIAKAIQEEQEKK
jgi:hypothetical protein